MSSTDQPPEDFMLDEDDDNSYLAPFGDLHATLVTSPTTDTLDSVVLETSPIDDEEKEIEREVTQEVASGQDANNDQSPDETQSIRRDTENALESCSDSKKNSEPANISSYFADSGDNFFDSLGPTPDNDSDFQLGTNLFTSIAISKSEEDILASELNATEIKVSDVLTDKEKSPESEYQLDLSRNESFQNADDLLEESPEKEEKGLNPNFETLQQEQEAKEEEDNITHIHHREHSTSVSEPEPISFEGESDEKDLIEKKEFEEFMAQAEDITGEPIFVNQKSSDSSEAPASFQHGQNLTSGFAESSKNPSSGLTVGTTPSQMSPTDTPVHQADHQDAFKSAINSTPVNPPGFQTQNSVPGSPFHQPSPEIKSGSVFSPFGVTGSGDDAFTSILSMSDADRRHDAWIPSDATSHILFSMATNPPGTVTPASEQLSTPGIISNELMGDPVRDLVLRYMGEQEAIKRSVLTVESVTQDVDGLKKLIESGCLRAAIDLTGRLLEQVGQGFSKTGQVTVHTPHSLQLWCCRFTLMVKLRMYDQAEAEMRAFHTLDTPDLYFQYYANSYPGRRGSMVSFSMRLLHAELPLLCGRNQESLDRLYYMLAVCNRIKTNLSSDLSEDGSATHMTYEARKVSLDFWNQRELQILYKIGSTMLAVKDYEAALVIYNDLLSREKTGQLELGAAIGRIHLQMGNLNDATRIIKEVEEESSKGSNSMPCFNLLNKGLLAMCSNNFYDGYQHFKSAVQIQPHNTCAVNNMAVCSLYLGRLKDALNTLEQLVHSDPANTLHEGVLFNLCTLYELETSRALHKKQAILDLVSKHKGDGFPIACLKMT